MNDIIGKLLDAGILDGKAAERVRSVSASGVPLDEALLSSAGLAEDKLLRILAAEFNIPYVEIEERFPSREFHEDFPAHILLERQLPPLEEKSGAVLIATNRIFNTTGIDELRLATNREFQFVLAPSAEI